MSQVLIKRIYDQRQEDDGWRVLVDRLWPRGVSKERAALDRWVKGIAPSGELRKWFDHMQTHFDSFASSYASELDGNKDMPQFLQEVREHLREGNVTLLYAAKDEQCNHAAILRDWLNRHL